MLKDTPESLAKAIVELIGHGYSDEPQIAGALRRFQQDLEVTQVQRAVEISDLLVGDMLTREKMARALRDPKFPCPTYAKSIRGS